MKVGRAAISLTFIFFASNVAYSQLNTVFDRIFDEILVEDLKGLGNEHEQHFIPAAQDANSILTPALNSMVASNVSSFPLSSTSAGLTFDFSTGQPVSIKESLGPIFAEKAETLGKGKINLAFNYTYLNLSRLRGIRTNNTDFTFPHQDVDPVGDPLGDPRFEADVIDVSLGLDINANIYSVSATYGIAHNLDFNVAVPFVNVSMSGTTKAVFNGLSAGDGPHKFADPTGNQIVVSQEVQYDESATGIGDVAVRLKYNFGRRQAFSFATLLDVRLPTGAEEDFLGTGSLTAKISAIASRKIGDFTPHLNVAYDRRSADLDSDEFELVFGFDQKAIGGLTFAADFIGEFDVQKAPKFVQQENRTLQARLGSFTMTRVIDLTNIPARSYDNQFSLAAGFRFAPSDRVLLLGNVIVPLNDGGLRSSVAPTLGLTISL